MTSFRLASLLRLRQTQEDQAAAALAEAHDLARRAEQRRVDTARMLGDTVFPDGTAEAHSFAAITAARAALSTRLTEASALVTTAGEGLFAAQSDYQQARTATLMLTKLQTRHDEQVTAEEARTEQIALDEIAARTVPTKDVTP